MNDRHTQQNQLQWTSTKFGGETAWCRFGKYIISELLETASGLFRTVHFYGFDEGHITANKICDLNDGDLEKCRNKCETHRYKLIYDEIQKLSGTSSEYVAYPDHTTVYPSQAGGFPPASFRNFDEALIYVREISQSRPPCGICTSPASSYNNGLFSTKIATEPINNVNNITIDNHRPTDRFTVYPKQCGTFPAASFWSLSSAWEYAAIIRATQSGGGICFCASQSYPMPEKTGAIYIYIINESYCGAGDGGISQLDKALDAARIAWGRP